EGQGTPAVGRRVIRGDDGSLSGQQEQSERCGENGASHGPSFAARETARPRLAAAPPAAAGTIPGAMPRRSCLLCGKLRERDGSERPYSQRFPLSPCHFLASIRSTRIQA